MCSDVDNDCTGTWGMVQDNLRTAWFRTQSAFDGMKKELTAEYGGRFLTIGEEDCDMMFCNKACFENHWCELINMIPNNDGEGCVCTIYSSSAETGETEHPGSTVHYICREEAEGF